MTKFFNKFKKPCFWSTFGPFSQFLSKINFSGKSGSVTYNFIWISSIMPKLKKTNDTIPRKHLDRRTDGKMDGQTLFYSTLPAAIRGPKTFC